MELRVLQYFLAVTREQSILKAAESLNLSQPTLSRQIRDMEAELGKQLFVRGARRITLTEEGMILRKRAEEIFELVKKAEDEIALAEEPVAGDITVGGGETVGMELLVQTAQTLRQTYPQVYLHVFSGDKCSVLEQLDRGLIDFGVVFGDFDQSKYEYAETGFSERYGVLMRRDDPLAEKEEIKPDDLWGRPIIVSRQAICDQSVTDILGCGEDDLNIVGSFNLLYNGSLMVEAGMGYAIAFDKIVNVTGDSRLCFRPLTQASPVPMYVVWKKYQIITKAAEKFLEQLREQIE